MPEVEVFEEWRVTGEPGRVHGSAVRYPSYDFTFGSPARRALGEDADPEAAARQFIARIRSRGGWEDGPHLLHRTVTISSWEDPDGPAPMSTMCPRCGQMRQLTRLGRFIEHTVEHDGTSGDRCPGSGH